METIRNSEYVDYIKSTFLHHYLKKTISSSSSSKDKFEVGSNAGSAPNIVLLKYKYKTPLHESEIVMDFEFQETVVNNK